MTNSKLPINLNDLLRQRTVEGERIAFDGGLILRLEVVDD
jgi:hypothetical protein